MTIGARIRTARIAAGLRQLDLAREAGVSRCQITNLEAGRSEPSLPTLEEICRACRVTPGYILGLMPPAERLDETAALRAEIGRLRRCLRQAARMLATWADEGEP